MRPSRISLRRTSKRCADLPKLHRRTSLIIVYEPELAEKSQQADRLNRSLQDLLGIVGCIQAASPSVKRPSAAWRRGRVGGRPPALSPEQRAEVRRLRDDDAASSKWPACSGSARAPSAGREGGRCAGFSRIASFVICGSSSRGLVR